MTEYTPEKVAELAELLRQIAESQRMDFDSPHVGMALDESADALTAVSANRDEFRTAWNAYGFEIIRLEDERDRLHKAITEALEALGDVTEQWKPLVVSDILRAALDKERT